MNNILQNLLQITVLSSVVIAAVLLLKLIYKNKLNPIVLSALWIVVLIRLLMPFNINSPIHLGDLFDANKQQEYAISDANAPLETTEQNQMINTGADTNNLIADTDYEHPQIENQQTAPKTTLLTELKAFFKSFDIQAALITLWAVAGLGIIFLCGYKMMLFGMGTKRTSIVDAKVLSSLQRAKRKIDIHKRVMVLECDNIDVPITYGLLSPKILLPSKMIHLIGEDRLELILMHELTHIKRGDIFKNYLWLLAKAIHWFNPLVWIAYRLYVSDTEIVCDSFVAKKLSDKDNITYTQSLLEAAKLSSQNAVYDAPVLLSFCKDSSKLRRRIMNILEPVNNSKRQINTIAIIMILVALVSFTTACISGSAESSTPAGMYEPTPTPIMAGTDENGDEIYMTPLPDVNQFAPTPTPEVIGYNDDGSEITQTYNPDIEYTPEPFNRSLWSDEDGQGSKESRTINGQEINVSFMLRYSSIPNPGEFAVMYAQPAKYDLGIAQRAVDYFFGSEYYTSVMIKDDYQRLIDLANESMQRDGITQSEKETIEADIEFYEERQKDAPDKNTQGEVAFSRDGNTISVKSYGLNGEMAELEMHNSIDERTMLFYSKGNLEKYCIEIGPSEPIGLEAHQAREQKWNIAEAAVRQLYGTLAVCAVSINSGVMVDTYMPEMDNEELLARSDVVPCDIFYFTPIYVRQAGVYGSMAISPDREGDPFKPGDLLLGEYCRVVVTDEGIVNLQWVNRQEYPSMMYETYVPIGIDDAVEVFYNNIFDAVAHEDPIAESVDIQIYAIEAGMVKKVLDDGRVEYRMGYAFKGTLVEHLPGGREFVRYGTADNICFMTVDIKDGSIIDIYK